MRTQDLNGVALQVAVLVAYGIWDTNATVGTKTTRRFCFVDSEQVSCSYERARAIFDFKKGDYVRLDDETVARLCEEHNISVVRHKREIDDTWWPYWEAYIGEITNPNRAIDSERNLAACKAFVKDLLGSHFDIDEHVKGV